MTQGPSPALTVVVVLAVTIATAGVGTSIGAAAATAVSAPGLAATVITSMTAAAFTSICCQAALALLSNEGNPIKAAESLASTRTLANLGIAMVTAGVTVGVTGALHIPPSTSIAATPLDHVSRQVIQSTLSTTASIATGQKPEDALISGLKGAAVGIVGGIATSEIGQAYLHHKVDFIGHKFLHALVGAGTGAILGGDKPLQGALAGAMGAVTAEMIGELVLMDSHKIANDVVQDLDAKNVSLTPRVISTAVIDELRMRTNFVKLLTSGIALLTGQDVAIASFVANTAIDNNLSRMACELIEVQVYDILGQEGASFKDPLQLPSAVASSASSSSSANEASIADEKVIKYMEKIDPPGHKTTLKEGTIAVLDFLIGDKETADSIQQVDDPATNLAGAALASGAMRAMRIASARVQYSIIEKAATQTSAVEPTQIVSQVAKEASTNIAYGSAVYDALETTHPGKAIVEDMLEVFATTHPGEARAEKFGEQVLRKHLGPDWTPGNPKESTSDLWFHSRNKEKQIRFDIIHSHGEPPHINVEIWEKKYPGAVRQKYREDGGNIHIIFGNGAGTK